MLLQDSIRVNVPAEQIFQFFAEMDKHYVDWHPDHHAFRWIEGNQLAVGTVFYFEETIGGHPQNKAMRFIEIEPNRLLVFEPMNWFIRLLMPRLSFGMEPLDAESCEFVAKIHLRVGPLGQRLNAKEFNAVRKHMREEGENLKQMVESAPFNSLTSERAIASISER